jgi:hypothetical protein
MAFDQNTRNRLARFVTDARTLLTEEFTRQLQRTYGIDPVSGEVTAVDRLAGISDAERQTAELLRETAEHYLPGFARLAAKSRRDTIERIVREQAFTVLNRLCALRMAEARGLLIESVAAGYQSRGFQLYARLAGAALGETGDAYRTYLFSLFDEFAVDLPVLFDRFAPEGRLFPGETALLALLDLVNHPEIEPLWAEDETIGWIYQYFNSKEERKAMRDASAAPRNSRELAVRNQFFTPRYVVEFLTDNTLGRIWYEMTKGETSLKESCRYLVRRPNEIFLAPGESVPPLPGVGEGAGGEGENLSQEELLHQPVYIPHRPLKDPRAITMLDPACGSMHFGLYAFDLFERIYDEAWELEGERGPKTLERAPMDAPLHEAYPNKDSFLRDVPRLIVERNIHGVDIDPRAVQIGGLSLWLRAQKSWREQSLKPQERPQIKRSNVVCAEPMPGDRDLLEEFIARHLSGNAEDKVVAWMLGRVFDAMTLAGEAGSLLKIEEEIAAIVGEAKKQWRQGPKLAQSTFFAEEAERITQRALDLDTSAITDATFWARAEERIDAALKDYAAFAEGDGAYRRRLFAGDAARAFAFIDLCRKRYDVVLMNPPFGAASAGWKSTFERAYPRSKNDLYAAFVERGVEVQQAGGMLGAITSRTGFFLTTFHRWRKEILLGIAPPTVFADLGYGVLDTAMVETAAYCLGKDVENEAVFIRLLNNNEKSPFLEKAISDINMGVAHTNTYITDISSFRQIPGVTFTYWVSERLRKLFIQLPSFSGNNRDCRIGLSTSDNFRFLRTWCEVPPGSVIFPQETTSQTTFRLQTFKGKQWAPFAKGGKSSLFYNDINLVVNWKQDGSEMKAWADPLYGNSGWSRIIQSVEYYFRPGITWPRRTNKLGFRILPYGTVFSDKGPVVVVDKDDADSLLALSAVLNSKIFYTFVKMLVARVSLAQSFEGGLIGSIPFPDMPDNNADILQRLARTSVDLKRNLDQTNEISHIFHMPALLYNSRETLSTQAATWALKIIDKDAEIAANQLKIDNISLQLYGIGSEEQYTNEENMGTQDSAVDIEADDEGDVEASADTQNLVSILVSYIAGCSWGRWDIRYATGERPAPDLPDPFAPLPVCPPGMLQNDQGLPAAPGDVPASYPLRISWPGILVDDEGHHEDIAGRVREAIQVIWGGRAEAIEQEACEILGVRSLREYFRNPALFFGDHLQRYSKSRRQAPIYWPLSTPSGSYTLWLYYHRLTDQTLYSCVNDFVEPKLAHVRDELGRLRQKSGRTRADEKELERLTDLEQELHDFRAELLRVAAFWKPNLNDGVQISAAPLWKLFQHKPWQKRLKETWEKLEAGEYDWAHLSYSIWPERVREKCKNDKALAIAHDLEALYVEPPAGAKKGRGKKTMGEMFEE